jgi:hypothetical protein
MRDQIGYDLLAVASATAVHLTRRRAVDWGRCATAICTTRR